MTGFNSKREAAADKMQEPAKEPVSFPCCGYTDANAIRWNQFNGVVQCHMCGQVYTVAQPAQEPVCDKDPQGCWNVRCQLGKQCKNLAQPAQRQWIWLSDADIAEVVDTTCQYTGSYEKYLIKKAERKSRSMNS